MAAGRSRSGPAPACNGTLRPSNASASNDHGTAPDERGVCAKLIRLNQPTPAIVSQDAVRRLPRAALLLFCIAYVVPGFVGRDPWKNADVTGFGYMMALARGAASWLAPSLAGQPPEFDALLPYWIGAWAIRALPWVPADLAARVPYALLLALALAATWYA